MRPLRFRKACKRFVNNTLYFRLAEGEGVSTVVNSVKYIAVSEIPCPPAFNTPVPHEVVRFLFEEQGLAQQYSSRVG